MHMRSIRDDVCILFKAHHNMALSKLQLALSLFFLILSYVYSEECLKEDEAECCRNSLLVGQFYCTSPRIDIDTQSEVNCTRQGVVSVPCFAAPNVSCVCEDESIIEYNISQCVFQQQQPCRYVKGRRYDYRVAVALSLFLGMFGIDRFYLGYPAIGLMKLCTLGFFFIGHLIDFLLILVQVVGPADRSSYYAPFYGPLISEVNTADPFLAGSGNTTCNTMS